MSFYSFLRNSLKSSDDIGIDSRILRSPTCCEEKKGRVWASSFLNSGPNHRQNALVACAVGQPSSAGQPESGRRKGARIASVRPERSGRLQHRGVLQFGFVISLVPPILLLCRSGLAGLEQLRKFDRAFADYEPRLFDPAAVSLNRAVLSKEEDEALNESLNRIIVYLSPYFHHNGCKQVLEWLIHKYHVRSLQDAFFYCSPFRSTCSTGTCWHPPSSCTTRPIRSADCSNS